LPCLGAKRDACAGAGRFRPCLYGPTFRKRCHVVHPNAMTVLVLPIALAVPRFEQMLIGQAMPYLPGGQPMQLDRITCELGQSLIGHLVVVGP
jgi:hypothetical protein